MDVKMPGRGGLFAAREIIAKHQGACIVDGGNHSMPFLFVADDRGAQGSGAIRI